MQEEATAQPTWDVDQRRVEDEIMLKNYLKIAFRNIYRNKVYSFINIFGFAVSLACAILVLLYVQNQLSFDRYNKHANRIYRVIKCMDFNGKKTVTPITGAPVAATLAREIPGIDEATRLFPARSYWNCAVGYDGKVLPENRFFFADSDFFSVFSIHVLEGDAATALARPNSVVLTRSTTKKFFGNENPVGKTIEVFLGRKKYRFQVTGVTENVPEASHFHFDFLASLSTLPFSRSASWWPNPFYTYILLKKNVYPAKLERELTRVVQEHVDLGPSHYGLKLQPLISIHLRSHYQFEIERNGSETDVYIFALVGLLLILISSVNYSNLATARASARAHEIGVRKVSGATRGQLFVQLMSETVVSVSSAVVIAVALAEVLLPVFNNLAGTALKIRPFGPEGIVPDLLLMTVGLSLLSGTYPALVITSFKPSVYMRGGTENIKGGKWLRAGLVTFQFAVSIVLIIAALVVQEQMSYVFQKRLGFDKQHILVISDAGALGGQWQAFVNGVESTPDVLRAAGAGSIPGRSFDTIGLALPGESGKYGIHRFDYDFVGANLLETLDIGILSGRDFTSDMASDTMDVLLNRSAVKALGLHNPVGKQVSIGFRSRPVTVIGVVHNFNFQSLRRQIAPLVLLALNRAPKYIVVRFAGVNTRQVVEDIGREWKGLAGGQPFVYSFLSRDFNSLYGSELRLGKILGVFSSLAVVIALLGLFGLSANTVERRTKEIGIRKVLGLSMPGAVLLVSRDFMKWVLIANAVAWPVAYYAMQEWLQEFAYRTNFNVWTFLFAAVITLAVALAATGVHSVKAAASNPIESLRYE